MPRSINVNAPLVPPLHSLKNSSGFSNWAIQAEAGATALEGEVKSCWTGAISSHGSQLKEDLTQR